MITWNQDKVSEFLGIRPFEDTAVSYEFPILGGHALLRIYPEEDRVALEAYDSTESEGSISAHIRCEEIEVSEEMREEGGQCLVLKGRGGHVTISPGTPHFAIFFSMHGNQTSAKS